MQERFFFNKCKEIIALYDNLPTEINSMFGLESGHINISMSAVMSMRKFIGILGNFTNCIRILHIISLKVEENYRAPHLKR